MDLAQKVHVTMMLWTDGASSDAAVPRNLKAAYASLYSLSDLAEATAARFKHVLQARFTHSRHVIPKCREIDKTCTSSNSLMVHLSLTNQMLNHLFMVHNSLLPSTMSGILISIV